MRGVEILEVGSKDMEDTVLDKACLPEAVELVDVEATDVGDISESGEEGGVMTHGSGMSQIKLSYLVFAMAVAINYKNNQRALCRLLWGWEV